jgi:vacuolar protein sorting-associated protein 35
LYIRISYFIREGGDFNDAINTILANLNEMNKLWTRVQSSGAKDKGKKDKERNDLKVIIGENLVRLSQLEGLTIELYKETVLDKIIEIVDINPFLCNTVRLSPRMIRSLNNI